MKNPKKLTRKCLDELANEMPQVNEIQQKECVGGTLYVNYCYSTPFTMIGETTDIAICRENYNPSSAISIFSRGNAADNSDVFIESARYAYVVDVLQTNRLGGVYISGVEFGENAYSAFSGGILYLQFAENSTPDVDTLNAGIRAAFANSF